MTELLSVLCNSALIDVGNGSWNILNGIKLPSLLVSFICYLSLFLACADSNLVNITDFTLLKFVYLIFTELKLLSLISILLCRALCPAGPHTLPCFLMVASGLVSAFVYSCRLL